MILIILIGVCVILIYYLLIKPNEYWKVRSVSYENPLPLFGNLASVIFQKRSMAEHLQDIYNKYKNKRYVGVYLFRTPSLILRDPDLIKQITVKQFDCYPQHNAFSSSETDPLWSSTLFAIPGGEEWMDIGAILSPAYTSSKLRAMFGLIQTSAKHFTDHFVKQDGFVTVDIMDSFTKATNNIVGVTCDSLKVPNNEVFLMENHASDCTGLIAGLKFLVAAVLMKLLKIRFINRDTSEFFKKIIEVTLREKKGIVRPDLLHLLMEARKDQLKHYNTGHGVTVVPESNKEKSHKTEITNDFMTAQVVNFFLRGFETVARAVSFTVYELAINPDIQERLQKEVSEVTLEMCNGQLTYEGLMNMKYLDMVVSEVLRKWPPFALTDRKSIKHFTIEPIHPDEIPLLLDTNVVCQIPIYSLHRDPQYFPNPEIFDPERFSDENKPNIKPFTYLPFESGPRNCIGSHLALLEVKTVIFHLLIEFEIVPVEKTDIPLVLSKANVNPFPDKGPWLGLKPRTRSS